MANKTALLTALLHSMGTAITELQRLLPIILKRVPGQLYLSDEEIRNLDFGGRSHSLKVVLEVYILAISVKSIQKALKAFSKVFLLNMHHFGSRVSRLLCSEDLS